MKPATSYPTKLVTSAQKYTSVVAAIGVQDEDKYPLGR